MHGRERLRLVFTAGLAAQYGEAAPSIDEVWALVEPTTVPPKHLSWRDKMQRRVMPPCCPGLPISDSPTRPAAQVSPGARRLRAREAPVEGRGGGLPAGSAPHACVQAGAVPHPAASAHRVALRQRRGWFEIGFCYWDALWVPGKQCPQASNARGVQHAADLGTLVCRTEVAAGVRSHGMRV